MAAQGYYDLVKSSKQDRAAAKQAEYDEAREAERCACSLICRCDKCQPETGLKSPTRSLLKAPTDLERFLAPSSPTKVSRPSATKRIETLVSRRSCATTRRRRRSRVWVEPLSRVDRASMRERRAGYRGGPSRVPSSALRVCMAALIDRV